MSVFMPRSAQYSWQNISRHQLLPAVAAFGHRRIGVRFLQAPRTFGSLLQLDVVGAGRGGEEVAPGAGPIGRLDHVRIDQDAAQALDAEPLDKAHAAHVGGQVVDLDGPLAGPPAVLFLAQVQAQALHARAPADTTRAAASCRRPNARKALIVEIPRQRAGDEAAGPGDDDQIVLLQDRGGLGILFCDHIVPSHYTLRTARPRIPGRESAS